MEAFFTGHCRACDTARTVLADNDEGEADCDFPGCAHAGACPIAAQLREFFGEATTVRETATQNVENRKK